MIAAKDGWREPMIGQSVYLLKKDGEPVAVALRYPDVVRKMQLDLADDFIELPWWG